MIKYLLPLFILFSCTDDETPTRDLDVVRAEAKTTEAVLAKEPLEVKSSDVVQWQKYFQTAPTPRERSMLEKNLSLNRKPEKPFQVLKNARNQATLGLYAEAESSYREVVRRDPYNQEAKLDLAFLFLKMNKLHEAFETLAQLKDEFASQENPDKELVFRYRYALALAYLGNRDRTKAHSILSDLIGQDRSFSPGYAALGGSYLALGKDAVAEFVVRRGLDRGKDDASLYNLLGVIEERKMRNFAARQNYNKAIEISPTFVPAMINRAQLAMKELEMSLAEEDLKKALSIDPMNVDGHIALGNVQRKTGRYPAARKSFDTAISLQPENATARFNLAILLAENMKKTDEALRLMSEVVQLSGDNRGLKDLAQSYMTELKTAKY